MQFEEIMKWALTDKRHFRACILACYVATMRLAIYDAILTSVAPLAYKGTPTLLVAKALLENCLQVVADGCGKAINHVNKKLKQIHAEPLANRHSQHAAVLKEIRTSESNKPDARQHVDLAFKHLIGMLELESVRI